MEMSKHMNTFNVSSVKSSLKSNLSVLIFKIYVLLPPKFASMQLSVPLALSG